jgi:hypothetical protein
MSSEDVAEKYSVSAAWIYSLRKLDELWKKLDELCDVFSPQECQNYFEHAGYNPGIQIPS